jgi:uncharacterized protein YbaP (TraB family)
MSNLNKETMKMLNGKTSALVMLIVGFQIIIPNSAISQKNEKSLLWAVSGNGMEQTSYLFGTIHVLDSSYFLMESIVVQKFNTSEKLVLEINMDDPDFQSKVIQSYIMKDDSLSNLLSPQEYRIVNDYFTDSIKIPLITVEKIKPFYLSEMVGLLKIPKNSKSFEEEFIKMAHEQNKGILGISTVEQESEIIGQLSFEIQTQILVESVNQEKILKDEIRRKKVLGLYLQQDIDEIHTTSKMAMSGYGNLYEIMFPQRHEVWVPNMEMLMRQHSCFFAVGVGHLAGETGLIDLLRRKGYEVNPIGKKL